MPSPVIGGGGTGEQPAPEPVKERRWSDHTTDARLQMAAVNGGAADAEAAAAGGGAEPQPREGFTVGLDASLEPAAEPSQALKLSQELSPVPAAELELRESFAAALDAVGTQFCECC